jgi:hypothetical protein
MKCTFKHVNPQDEQRLLIKLFVENGFSRVYVVHVGFLILFLTLFLLLILCSSKQEMRNWGHSILILIVNLIKPFIVLQVVKCSRGLFSLVSFKCDFWFFPGMVNS